MLGLFSDQRVWQTRAMAKPLILQTPRLNASPIEPDDFALLRELHGDAKVMRSLSVDGLPVPESTTQDFLENAETHWRDHDFGVWALTLNECGTFVGYCGLRHVNLEGRPEVELLYALSSSHWGNGLASEAARAVIDIAFSSLKLETVAAYTLPTNKASQRVMEKSGMRYERYITHASLPHLLYRITALQYQMSRQIKPAGQSRAS